MSTHESAVRVGESSVVSPSAQSKGVPSLAIPIIFGWAGAWWASNKAAKLGVGDTGRYWKAAIISTITVAAVSVVVPIVVIVLIGMTLHVGQATRADASAIGSGSTAPGISGGPSGSATAAPSGGATTAPVDPTKVASLMQKVVANPKDKASLQALGDVYFAAGDYKNATVWDQKVLTVDPKNRLALLGVGAAQFNLGNSAYAERQWLFAAGLYPEDAEVHYDLGFLYMSATPPDSAKMMVEWKKVVAIDPNSNLAKTVATHLSSSTAPSTPSPK
ncbi:MAG: hypothetical protein ABI903_00615 [Actinomycetota bacterium]